ncbi:632_t:CDS:1 [Acaulospora morrowiae]|uniref:632_t:CDS:1 n=1 Tax=Acaulospora morrowiae TaxID=94023 RepID=A0A9N9IZ45_9GLOM|nr:632_t:CDS:1 [Acaulospora morrowiae]
MLILGGTDMQQYFAHIGTKSVKPRRELHMKPSSEFEDGSLCVEQYEMLPRFLKLTWVICLGDHARICLDSCRIESSEGSRGYGHHTQQHPSSSCSKVSKNMFKAPGLRYHFPNTSYVRVSVRTNVRFS